MKPVKMENWVFDVAVLDGFVEDSHSSEPIDDKNDGGSQKKEDCQPVDERPTTKVKMENLADEPPRKKVKTEKSADELPTTKVKLENAVLGEDVSGLGEPIGTSQRRFKSENDLDGQLEDVKSVQVQTETTSFGSYDFNELVVANQRRLKKEGKSV